MGPVDHVGKKRRLVISAVNCVDGGILSILQDCVSSVCREHAEDWDIVVLANSRRLLPETTATVLEFPKIKGSWIARLKHEWIHSLKLSRQLDADVWLSLHDISANVRARRRVVYCHNPIPFYPFRLRDAIHNWKLTAFSLFYGKLYGVNIHSNDFVVVQQDWLRREFMRRYDLSNVIVAHPEGALWPLADRGAVAGFVGDRKTRFCYPFVPLFFKNVEVICDAARMLLESKHENFEIILTMDGSETGYANRMRRRYGHLTNISFVGRLSREQVFELYRSSDCLVFASKLETWGLPISEFKATRRAMLIADKPYARETVGDYPNVEYFDAGDARQLAGLMLQVMSGTFSPAASTSAMKVPEPHAASWSALWAMILRP
jgi:glycosyltransferase involved in cell wall biosynthesis